MKYRKQQLIHWAVYLFTITVLVWVSSNINWEERRAGRIINVDGNGYYAYLPAIFIYNDLNFTFFDDIYEKYQISNFGFDYRNEWEGHTINKFYAGTALVQLPFFLLADLVTAFSSPDRDGYSYYYLLFINIASLFYLMLALFLFDRYLREEGLRLWVRTFLLLVMVFGTNVFYYAVYEPSMSHIYSLAFVSMYLFSLKRFASTRKKTLLLLTGLSLGLIALIRPVNLLLVLLVPFLLRGSGISLEYLVRSNWKWLIGGVVIFLGVVFIQLLIYKLQTGSFLVYSYGDDGFDFTNSRFFSFLVSYRKGLWVYTPVTFVSVFGIFFLWKRSRTRAILIILFLIILIYILASWHQWYYGGSYSSRVMVEYMPLFMFLLGILLTDIRNKAVRNTLIGLVVLLSLFNLFQTYQYYAGIIHWTDMDREYYWDVFLHLTNPRS